MMLRNKRIIHLVTALAVAMVNMAAPADAEFCLWCDPVISQNFLLCVSGKIMNDARFSASAEALDDMKNSIMAASQAMKRSSESTKMNMMNGAMAGELAELIKSQPSIGNLKETTSYFMVIVRDCYVQASGQPHYSFMKDIGKTVDFMLNDDSPSDDDSETKSGPPQYAPQAMTNSAAYSGQNIGAPNYNAPEQLPSFTQSVSNAFIPNQMFVPPSSGITPGVSQRYPQTGLGYPADFDRGKGQATAVSLNYPSNNQNNGPFNRPGPNVQLPITQTNAASSYDSFGQNKSPNLVSDQNKWSGFATYVDSPQNNVGRPGAVFRTGGLFNYLDQSQLQNTKPLNNLAPSSVAQKSNAASSGALFGANPPNIGLDQFLPQFNEPVKNVGPGYGVNDQRNLQNSVPRLAMPQPISAAKGGASTFILQGKNFPSYYPQNQLLQNSNSDDGTLGQNGAYSLNNVNNSPDQTGQMTSGASSDYDYQPDYNYYEDYPESRDLYDYSSNQPAQSASNWNYPPLPVLNNYPLSKNAPGTMNPVQPDSYKKPKENSDDQPPRVISENSLPPRFPMVANGKIWGPNSGGNGFPSDNSQPNNGVTTALDDKGRNAAPQSESTPKVGKWAPTTKAKSGEPKSSSGAGNDDVTRAMRFAETVYVICSKSQKFKSVFSKRISNNKAASYTYKMIRGALKDCGYLDNSEEIAKSCSDTVKALPEKCPAVEYAEAISKSLMDEFYTRKLIGEDPENQAKSLTTAFLARLKKRKSPGSQKLAPKSYSSSVASSSSDSLSDYSTNSGNDKSLDLYDEDYPKANDGTRKENYGEYSDYDDLPAKGSSGESSAKDDSNEKQYSGGNDDYYNEYDNYPNPTTDYPIKTNLPKSKQTTQKIENPKEPCLGKKVPKTGYYYDKMYGNYDNLQENNGQNQKSTGKISPKGNMKYDYNRNANYYYDPNYDYYNDNNYYDYNRPNIGKIDSPKNNYNQNNDYSNQYYTNFDNRKARLNQQSDDKTDLPDDYYDQTTEDYNPRKDNLPQNANSDAYDYSGSNSRQPDSSYKRQKLTNSASSLPITEQNEKDDGKNGITTEKVENESTLDKDYTDILTSTSEENLINPQASPKNGTILKQDNLEPGQSELPDSTSNDDNEKLYSDTALGKPDNKKAERKNRLEILMKWALSSVENGKFNYKVYSNVISAMAKYLQNKHPELGSQTCFLTILIEALVACTQLLTKIPQEYLNKMSAPEYTDAADETISNWSTSTLNQENQDSLQPDQTNSAQNVQTGVVPQMQSQENNWNNGNQMSQSNSPPSVLYNNAMRGGYRNSYADSNLNPLLPKQDNVIQTNIPQSGGGLLTVPYSQNGYNDLPQQNNWNYEYRSNQRNSPLPDLNSNMAQQQYNNRFADANLNAPLPRQESWNPNIPKSGGGPLAVPSSQEGYKDLAQQNNWNYDYQSSQGNSFQPELNNKQQGYGNRFQDSNVNAQLPGQGS